MVKSVSVTSAVNMETTTHCYFIHYGAVDMKANFSTIKPIEHLPMVQIENLLKNCIKNSCLKKDIIISHGKR